MFKQKNNNAVFLQRNRVIEPLTVFSEIVVVSNHLDPALLFLRVLQGGPCFEQRKFIIQKTTSHEILDVYLNTS